MPAVNTMFGAGLGIGGGNTAPMSDFQQTPSPAATGHAEVGSNLSLIDGTPMRVATIIVLTVAGLAGLRWAGFKFNVTTGVG